MPSPGSTFIQGKLEALDEGCRLRGLPVTKQRRTVLRHLAEHSGHPTVDQLHEVVSAELPRISRTTVYRILETFVEMGLATKAMHPGAIVRYDARTDDHDHLFCESCGRIFDYQDPSWPRPRPPVAPPDGFKVTGVSLYLRGICRDCGEEASP